MKKASLLNRFSWEAKTLVVVDRLKFRGYLNWTQNIQNIKLKSIKQLSNHALLLDVQKEGFKYSCYFTSITSKSKSITLTEDISTDLIEFKLVNGESRYIPKVIYKYKFTKDELINLFNLEHENSIALNSIIKQWDKNNILNEWEEKLKLNDVSFIDLDLTKQNGILNVDIFKGKLSDAIWDIEVIKNLIANGEI